MSDQINNLRANLQAIRDTIDLDVGQDIHAQSEKLRDLTNIIGLSAETVATSRKIYAEKYNEVVQSYLNSKKYEKHTATILKKLIEGDCSTEQALVDMAERLNAGMVHSIDGIRSIISLYKSELEKGL